MQKKILIIDDHDDLGTALSGLYSDKGYEVSVCVNRDEAIELASRNKFDVVVTDLDGSHLVAPGDASSDADLVCFPDPIQESRANYKAFKICLTNLREENFKSLIFNLKCQLTGPTASAFESIGLTCEPHQ